VSSTIRMVWNDRLIVIWGNSEAFQIPHGPQARDAYQIFSLGFLPFWVTHFFLTNGYFAPTLDTSRNVLVAIAPFTLLPTRSV